MINQTPWTERISWFRIDSFCRKSREKSSVKQAKWAKYSLDQNMPAKLTVAYFDAPVSDG